MRLGVCLEMFFQDLPFVDRIAKAADAGYAFAEMWFIDGTAWDSGMNPNDPKIPAKVAAAARKAGMTLTNAVIGSPDGTLGGGLTDPRHRDEWLRRADKTLAFCRDAGVGACIACTGNIVKGKSIRAMRRSVIDGLKATAERAEKAGVDIWLEPLNDKIDHPEYFSTSSDDAAAICREVGSPRMKLLFDCYHMQIMEGDLHGHIKRNLDVIAHMHAAGHPGRHELWFGETHYPFLAQEVEKLGYKNVFTMEYMPTLDSSESLRKAREYLSGSVAFARPL